MTPNPLLTPQEAQRLGVARVGIAGAGGLGSNIAMHLTRAGVGHLTVVDFDVVSESNLNRQFYFRDQLGLPKVAALCTNLLRIAPALDLRTHAKRLTEADFRPVFADCEVVVEAFDNPEAKAAFLRALLPTGKPLVCASGMAGWGRSGAITLRRLGPTLYLAGDASTAASATCPPASPRVGIVAALQANTVIALLLGVQP